MQRAFLRRIVFLCVGLLVGWAGMSTGACSTALLVIDVQTVFLDWHPWTTVAEQDIVFALEELLSFARGAGIPVIYIQDITQDPGLMASEAMSFAPEIEPHEGEPVFTKLSGDAFSNPDLERYLEANEIQQLLFSGIASDGCVHATLGSAYRAGYDIFVVTDVHAHRDGTPESAVQWNRYWLGLGLEGQPMAEINWEAFGCGIEDAESDF